jgi:hypothetical protein
MNEVEECYQLFDLIVFDEWTGNTSYIEVKTARDWFFLSNNRVKYA